MAAQRKPRPKADAKTKTGEVVEETRGVFMISIAADLAGMHPQTLRMYEARGLITPQRSPKNTRLYSQADVERLQRIQQLTSEQGLNLAGVVAMLEMEESVARMRAEMARMRERADRMEREMVAEMERLRSAVGGEMVPYGAYEGHGVGKPRQTGGPTRIEVKRRGRSK
jgi:MerR family transcriptional regulator/heat shock protein HspR